MDLRSKSPRKRRSYATRHEDEKKQKQQKTAIFDIGDKIFCYRADSSVLDKGRIVDVFRSSDCATEATYAVIFPDNLLEIVSYEQMFQCSQKKNGEKRERKRSGQLSP